MFIEIPVPASVTPMKVYDWTVSTAEREGFVLGGVFQDVSGSFCNWILFYAWCYARTNGFTNENILYWDVANKGRKFETHKEGCQDALCEFLAFRSTEEMPEKAETERIYAEIIAFCEGNIYDKPKPLPIPPKPEPIPEPQPEPKPEEPKPNEPGKPFNWGWLKWALPIIGALAAAGSMFLPGWAKLIVDVILKLLNGLSAQ